jgi:hypothetical protein
MHRSPEGKQAIPGALAPIQRFNASTLQRFNASTLQRFNASTLQRFNPSTLQRFNAEPSLQAVYFDQAHPDAVVNPTYNRGVIAGR